jgi:hypothetical protein
LAHGAPNLRPPLRPAVLAEVARRRLQKEVPPPPLRPTPEYEVIEELIGAGLRAMAKRHHPDLGGDLRKMQEVTSAADWLRGRTRGVR